VGIYAEPRFLPCGDLALSVELGDDINRDVNARVLALEYLIQRKALAGVTETVPSYRSLLVYYDPLSVGWEELTRSLRALWREARPEVLPPARTVEIPCCYGGELGFELEAAAKKIGLAADEMARRHASSDYYVYFVGFTPGLPYMTGMPERLTIPRLDQPRTKTPPGSVSIGGIQCCIYSVESPGGFWVLGRTPLRLYDPAAAEPSLLRAGDHVRFRMIDRAEFDTIASAVAEGTYAPRIEAASSPPPTGERAG
jgi:inhibitor of KinA